MAKLDGMERQAQMEWLRIVEDHKKQGLLHKIGLSKTDAERVLRQVQESL